MANELNIANFRIEFQDTSAAILADVNGEAELEWLDDDGDVTPCDSHLCTNRCDVFDDHEICEIHEAMQDFIDSMSEADRDELRERCAEIKAANDAVDEAIREEMRATAV